jgi:SAM-dependent methyltransferase
MDHSCAACCDRKSLRHRLRTLSPVPRRESVGPLYHLTEAAQRRQALAEARQALRPGGRLLAMAVCRFASLLDGLYEGWLDDPDFRPIMEQDLVDGQHRDPDPVGRPEFFTTDHFHTPDGLAGEIGRAGVTGVAVAPVPALVCRHQIVPGAGLTPRDARAGRVGICRWRCRDL